MKKIGLLGINPNRPIFFGLNSFLSRNKLKALCDYNFRLPFIYLGTVFVLFERNERGERWLWRIWKWDQKCPVPLVLLGYHFEQVQKFRKAHTVWEIYKKRFSEDVSLLLRLVNAKNHINKHEESIAILEKLLEENNNENTVLSIKLELSNAYSTQKEYQKAFEILRNLNEENNLTSDLREICIIRAYQALQYEYGDRLLDQYPKSSLKRALIHLELLMHKNEYKKALDVVDQLVQAYPGQRNLKWRQFTIYSNYYNKSKKPVIGDQIGILLRQLEKTKNWYEPRILNEKIRLAIFQNEHKLAFQLIKHLPRNHSKFVLKVKMWEAHQKGQYKLEKQLWRLFKKLYHIPQIQSPKCKELTLISGYPELPSTGEIPLFTCIKNEIDRLDWFLSYYRKLGVTRFFFIDNNSNDGSTEFLQRQSDVVLFWTNEKYARGYSGIKWINHLIEKYAGDNWTIYVDVDEALVYASSEHIPLKQFTGQLEEQGIQALHAPMVDMFDTSTIHGSSSTNDYLQEYPFYLKDRQTIGALRPPYIADFGGIRKYFGVYECHTKMPLIHFKYKIQFLNSSHNISPAVIFEKGGVLLHFRLVNNFLDKIEEELQDPNRVMACMSRLKSYLERSTDLSVGEVRNNKNIRKYSDSSDLIREGLIKKLL